MKIGRRIYYDKSSGSVLIDTGERSGDVIVMSPEQDIEVYQKLNERVRDTFDYIELDYGQYQEDFTRATSYRVDLTTKQLVFQYNDVAPSPEPTPYVKPLSDRVDDLEEALNIILMGGM